MLDDHLIPVLVMMIKDGKIDLQKEACWVICNAICGGSPNQILTIVQENGVIPAICKMMNPNSEPKLLTIILDSLDRCLMVGERGGDEV